MLRQLHTAEEPKPALSLPVTPPTSDTTSEIAEAQIAQTVTERLAEMRRKTRRYKKRFLLIFPALGGPFLLLPPYLWLLHHLESLTAIYTSLAVLFAALTILPLILIRLCFGRQQIDADKLIRLGGIKAVGPLLEMRTVAVVPDDYKAIDAALIQLLPQMRASDAALLTANQRILLYNLLQRVTEFGASSNVNYEVCLAALKALEQIGDAKAIPIVERIANMKTRTPRRQQIKQAAIECLPLLRANHTAVDANRMLLRASSAAPIAPDTLLRPAMPAPDPAPQQLLRASHASDNAPPAD